MPTIACKCAEFGSTVFKRERHASADQFVRGSLSDLELANVETILVSPTAFVARLSSFVADSRDDFFVRESVSSNTVQAKSASRVRKFHDVAE